MLVNESLFRRCYYLVAMINIYRILEYREETVNYIFLFTGSLYFMLSDVTTLSIYLRALGIYVSKQAPLA